MADRLATLRLSTWVVHALALLAVALLLSRAGVIAGMCVVVGALIGCAGVPSVPGRPVSLYVTFGAVMGYAFWLCVGVVHRGDFLGLVPALLLVAGAAWLLREPGWPSLGFTWAAVILCLVIVSYNYEHRHELAADADPELLARGAATAGVLLGVALVESALGFTETVWGRRKKKKKRNPLRALRTPSDPPVL